MGPNGLLYGNPSQLLIQAIGVGVAGVMGFFGTYIILKVIDVLIGIRVSAKVAQEGLDISEHAERAYSDEMSLKGIRFTLSATALKIESVGARY